MKDKALDFLKFRTFITHQIVKVLFWLSAVLAVLVVPLVSVVTLATEGFVAGMVSFIVSAIVAAIFILLSRIYSELTIVIFGIHDELKAANDREDGKVSEVTSS